MPVRIRDRVPGDAAELVAALRPVQERDGYPIAPEHVSATWLYAPGQERAWVAELDGAVAGHAVVVRGFGAPTVHDALGLPAEQVLGVSRLFVALASRGAGVAGALLDVVDAYAEAMHAGLALDVAAHNTDAIALYERRGWTRVAEFRANWFGPDGPHPLAYYYAKHPA